MDIQNLTAHPVGLDAHLGVRYHSVSPTELVASMVVSEHHLQPAGLVHGGVYCALAESAGSVLGMAVLQARGEEDADAMVVGVNNSTDFLHPVKSGVIDVVATVITAGRRTQLLNIEMRNRDRLVARTTLRTMVVPTVVDKERTQ
ncbi:PaaI family thioesterase [Corynebacterium aquilae]|nr:PaaI family thioesterase [Corynebacterium aquilae]